jgi:hypothetical protein
VIILDSMVRIDALRDRSGNARKALEARHGEESMDITRAKRHRLHDRAACHGA